MIQRKVLVALILLCVTLQIPTGQSSRAFIEQPIFSTPNIIVGGQNGTWFRPGQAPRLLLVNLNDNYIETLNTFGGQGTIWDGSRSLNGSQFLITGWGEDQFKANPPIIIYNDSLSVIYKSVYPTNINESWYGGDIFSSSNNGTAWLISGMGSGGNFSTVIGNHMALGLFENGTFTDLTSQIPHLSLGILYANFWNGSLWMVGGGYLDSEVLFTYHNGLVTDLTEMIKQEIPDVGAITSISWNGTDWMIGGDHFLAEYSNNHFIDLTQSLYNIQNPFGAVNTIKWDDQSDLWLIGGGEPKAITDPNNAWIAAISTNNIITDFSSLLPTYITRNTEASSILTSTYVNGIWIIGGYYETASSVHPLLVAIDLHSHFAIDYSDRLDGYLSYIIWIRFD